MDVREMPLADLVVACREETERFLRREAQGSTFCWELTRRAICARDQEAWEALFRQYRGLVLAWIRQHPASSMIDEEDDYWVTRTFARFWTSVGAERFDQFTGLPQLLQYLKMCAHSLLLDEARARRRQQVEVSADEVRPTQWAAAEDTVDAEALAVGQVAAGRLWEAVMAETQTEAERLVARLAFVLHLKPREIQARHPDQFPTVADVYRVSHNLKERLRRSREIRAFLS